jgi:excisionase family DNA binding protein
VSIEEKLERIEALLQHALPAAEFYSIRQAARVIGVSPDHIRRAVTGGMLAVSNVGTMGRPMYRIARADLLAWMERGKAGCVAAASRKRTITPMSRHHRRSAEHSDAHDA